MPTQQEIAVALQGAIRLAKLDGSGLNFFDRTLDGFWKSFFAAAMVAPLLIAVTYMTEPPTPDSVSWLKIAVVEASAYATRWLAYPVLMLHLTELLGRRSRYFDFMVPYNWVNVPQTMLWAMVSLVTTIGVLPNMMSQGLWLVAFVSIIVYQWFVAKVGLMVPGNIAAMLVLLDLAVSLGIGAVKLRLLGI